MHRDRNNHNIYFQGLSCSLSNRPPLSGLIFLVQCWSTNTRTNFTVSLPWQPRPCPHWHPQMNTRTNIFIYLCLIYMDEGSRVGEQSERERSAHWRSSSFWSVRVLFEVSRWRGEGGQGRREGAHHRKKRGGGLFYIWLAIVYDPNIHHGCHLLCATQCSYCLFHNHMLSIIVSYLRTFYMLTNTSDLGYEWVFGGLS